MSVGCVLGLWVVSGVRVVPMNEMITVRVGGRVSGLEVGSYLHTVSLK